MMGLPLLATPLTMALRVATGVASAVYRTRQLRAERDCVYAVTSRDARWELHALEPGGVRRLARVEGVGDIAASDTIARAILDDILGLSSASSLVRALGARLFILRFRREFTIDDRELRAWLRARPDIVVLA